MVHKYTAGKLQSFSYLINRYQMFRLFNWKIHNRQLHLSVWLDGIIEMIMQILIFFPFCYSGFCKYNFLINTQGVIYTLSVDCLYIFLQTNFEK